MLERKLASTGDLTQNHQVMSMTCSPLIHPGMAKPSNKKINIANMTFSVFDRIENIVDRRENAGY